MTHLTNMELPSTRNALMAEQGLGSIHAHSPTPLQKIGHALYQSGKALVGGAVGGVIGALTANKITSLLEYIPSVHEAISLRRDLVITSTTATGLLIGITLGATEIDTCRTKISRCIIWMFKKSHIRELPTDFHRPLPLQKAPPMSTTPSFFQRITRSFLKSLGHGIEMSIGGAAGGFIVTALVEVGVQTAFHAAGIHDTKKIFNTAIRAGMGGLFLGTVAGAAIVHAKQESIHACISKILSRTHLN